LSEIGLVVNDVAATKDVLENRFSINGYKDFHHSFAAVGDEQGLFILSAHRRVGWAQVKR
jgi:hypothetical protein